MVASLAEQGAELYARNLKVFEEEIRIHNEPRARLARPNTVRRYLRTTKVREYGKLGGISTLVDAPHAGQAAMIADYHKCQSLIGTIFANGIGHIAFTDWKPASDDMKDLEIDNYLAEGRRGKVYLGTPKDKIEKKMCIAGSHIGLSMCSRTLIRAWPAISHWLSV